VRGGQDEVRRDEDARAFADLVSDAVVQRDGDVRRFEGRDTRGGALVGRRAPARRDGADRGNEDAHASHPESSLHHA